MKKQKQLKRLREIEKDGCGRDFKFMNAIFTCVGKLDGELEICPNCKKEAQEIKDNWKDGCGIEILKSNNKPIYCGEMFFGKIRFCNNCLKQNKEKDEILGRILG